MNRQHLCHHALRVTAKIPLLILLSALPFLLVCPPVRAHHSGAEGRSSNDFATISHGAAEEVAAETIEERLVPFTDASGQVLELWMRQKTVPAYADANTVYPESAVRAMHSLRSAAETSSRIIMESPGVLQVREGQHCEDTISTGQAPVLSAFRSEKLPDYATDATVILNGWRLLFIDSSEVCTSSHSNVPCFVWKGTPPEVDHHVQKMGLGIGHIEKIADGLYWEVRGGLRDATDDYNPVGMCYSYMVIAWDDSRLSLQADSDLVGPDETCLADELDRCAETRDFLNPAPNPAAAAVILPRGTESGWEFVEDHHLLQIAKSYKTLGRVDSPPGSRRVSYETRTIWKDDSDRHIQSGNTLISLGGTDLAVLQPPFGLSPREASSADGCISDATRFLVREMEVDVPFEFALPVLTGWDIWHPCEDAHVGETGIWLHNIGFDKKVGDDLGTLRYTVSSVFRDADGHPGHRAEPMVTILGLDAPRSIDPAILGLIVNMINLLQ